MGNKIAKDFIDACSAHLREQSSESKAALVRACDALNRELPHLGRGDASACAIAMSACAHAGVVVGS